MDAPARDVARLREWSVAEFHWRVFERRPMMLLDLRSRSEYDAWRIDPSESLATVNIPRTEVLDSEGTSDLRASFGPYARKHLGDVLPQDRPVVVVCAVGKSSQQAAEALRESGYDAVTLQGGMQAWAAFHDFRTVVESDELAIYQCSRPARGCLGYVVVSGGDAAVIDPFRMINNYTDFVAHHGAQIRMVIDTHGHADHVSGGPALAQSANAPYWLHPFDALHPIDLIPGNLDFEYLRDKQQLRLGRSRIEAIHVPGHTMGNMAFLVDGEYLLTGDSVFISSIARPDLGGRPDTWTALHYHSLRRLMALPAATHVLPGHTSDPAEANRDGLYTGRLGDLMASNSGLQMAQRDLPTFSDYILRSLPKSMPEYVEIKRVNAGLITVSDDMAATLETGKNVCALGPGS